MLFRSLFVDGSCGSKQDVGAWAAIAATQAHRKILYGTAYPSTISRCELLPIIEGLRWIKRNWVKGHGFRVAVYSDSEYTVKTLSGLYEQRKNEELWAAVAVAATGLQVRYVWRERNTMLYMELCDALCGNLRRAMINVLRPCFEDIKQPEKLLPFGALPDDIDDQEENSEISTHS